jgi:hypothetical protein
MNVELLRQALLGIQAHAAGMHASADLALRLLGEARAETAKPPTPMYGGKPAQHYGEPDPAEIEKHLSAVETGAVAPQPPQAEQP